MKLFGAITLGLAASALVACNAETGSTAEPEGDHVKRRVVQRMVDPEAGKKLFVEKSCVVCHAVQGVGGKAAPAMDAEIGAPPIDPLEFAARMWLGAPAMIELQRVELGYSVYLTADQIADLAAFAGDIDVQRTFSADDLPAEVKDSLLDEQFWEVEDWDEVLEEGREGVGEPEPEPAPVEE